MAGPEEIVDIAELDCIYLSYDEPEKELFWAKINAMVPWAKRVDGVKGSDAAHKAAAAASDTERFILIDGDNIPDVAFFDQQLLLGQAHENVVFRWKARNIINGLAYGNGGISCWTRTYVNNMQSHELATDHNRVDFCWDDDYWSMHDVWSTTFPNQRPYQAWRAGFREGVKMCLDRGVKTELSKLNPSNLKNLSIWHNIGADVSNGNWAMLGARMGTYWTLCTDWDYREVHDFAALLDIFNSKFADFKFVNNDFDYYGKKLAELGLIQLPLDENYSKFFKQHIVQRPNRGIMVREGHNE